MSRIAEITMRRLRVPLTVPYKVSLRTFTHFEPIVAEICDADGRVGWGEAEIHRGYGHETPESGWNYGLAMAPRLLGLDFAAAADVIAPTVAADPHAASVMMSAVETLAGHPALSLREPASVPLLAPVHTMDIERLGEEIDETLAQGFATLKVKVGFDAAADRKRVAAIQKAVAGRATIRLDANQAFGVEEACSFAAALQPDGIELFEQPCSKEDWAANAAVAKVSTVPVMLDESIYGLADIERAAGLPGVRYVKLKLKKLGGVTALIEGLHRIRQRGMEPVLGDGTATEIACWLEACVARQTIRNAGEMNGFLKLAIPLANPPLPFAGGAIRLPAGYVPAIDRAAVERCTVAAQHFAARPRTARAGR